MLDADSADTLRLAPAQAHTLGMDALAGIGIAEAEARVIVDHLLDNMLCGYPFAGLPRILAIADRPEMKQPWQPITVVHDTPVSALIDGGNHVGYLPVAMATDLALAKAQASGFALVGVGNAWFSGRNAYYLERIGRAGLIGIHTASGAGMVVPPGARQALLGTNPIAFALPSEPDPLVFDMGTGATMWGEVLLKALRGEHFEEGIGIDAEGNPTTSAQAMAAGGVLPFGGHKGFGLSLVVQALGILAGASRARGSVIDSAFLFIVFSPSLLMPVERFRSELATMIETIKALPKQAGTSAIRIPSERAYREREIRRREGVLLDRKAHERLLALRSPGTA